MPDLNMLMLMFGPHNSRLNLQLLVGGELDLVGGELDLVQSKWGRTRWGRTRHGAKPADTIYIVRKKSGCELSFTRANVLAIDSHSICDKNITFPVV